MQHVRPCSFGSEADHVEWHCPELVAPIRDQGMMKPPAGTPMSGGDDDDRALKNLNAGSPVSIGPRTIQPRHLNQNGLRNLLR